MPSRASKDAAKYLLDATEWGDGIAKSGNGWVVGQENRSAHNEKNAPETAQPRTESHDPKVPEAWKAFMRTGSTWIWYSFSKPPMLATSATPSTPCNM